MCWLGLSFQKDQSFNNKGSGSNGPNDHVHYVGAQGWGGDNGLNNVGDGTKDLFTSLSLTCPISTKNASTVISVV